jgi:hypothetical protein
MDLGREGKGSLVFSDLYVSWASVIETLRKSRQKMLCCLYGTAILSPVQLKSKKSGQFLPAAIITSEEWDLICFLHPNNSLLSESFFSGERDIYSHIQIASTQVIKRLSCMSCLQDPPLLAGSWEIVRV